MNQAIVRENTAVAAMNLIGFTQTFTSLSVRASTSDATDAANSKPSIASA